MGKRNKFSKIGVSSAKLNNSKKKEERINRNNISKLNKTQMEMSDSDDDMDLNQTLNLNNTTMNMNKSKLSNLNTAKNPNQSILNESLVEKQSNITGIDKETLRGYLQNPTRHRRAITKIVLSKGQKKDKLKRKGLLKKWNFVKKLKLVIR